VLAVPRADRDILEDHERAGDDLEILLRGAGQQLLQPAVAAGCRAMGAERVQGGDADLRCGRRRDAAPEKFLRLASRYDAENAQDRGLRAWGDLLALAVGQRIGQEFREGASLQWR